MDKNTKDLLEIVSFIKDQVSEMNGRMATKDDIASIESRMATKDDIASIESRMATKDDIALIVEHMVTKEDIADMANKADIEMLHHEIVGKTNSAHTRIDQEVDKHNQLEVRVVRLERLIESK